MIRNTVTICLLMFVSATAGAQTKKWTLEACVQTALDNNLQVKRGYYNVQSAKVQYRQAWGAFLPTANVSSSYGQNFGRNLNPVTNSYIARNNNTLNIGGSGSLLLFNGMRVYNTFRRSRLDVEASNFDLKKNKNDVILDVVTKFTNVLFNKELHDNAAYVLASSNEQLLQVQKQVEVGARAKADLYTQEATVASNELTLINQENALNLSLLQLKQAMQVSSETPVEIDVPDLQPEDLVLDETPETIFHVAQEKMPEIKSATTRLESARLALNAAKGGLYPRLSFNANMQSNYASISDVPRTELTNSISATSIPIGVDANGVSVFGYQQDRRQVSDGYGRVDQLQDNLFKNFSLQLTIPIFNGFQNRAAVQRAAISHELARVSKEETENMLRQTIEMVYNDTQAASRSYGASLKQMQAQEEAYRISKQRFDLGALSAVELKVSENDWLRAKTDLTRAKYNYIFRKKALDFYLGKEITY